MQQFSGKNAKRFCSQWRKHNKTFSVSEELELGKCEYCFRPKEQTVNEENVKPTISKCTDWLTSLKTKRTEIQSERRRESYKD